MAIKNKTILPLILIISILVLGIGYFILKVYLPRFQPKQPVYTAVNQKGLNFLDSSKFLSSSTKGMMILIEFDEDTTGLSNFANMASERNIPTVLLIGPEFIKDHCEELKTLKGLGMDIGAGVNSKPFWDVPYQEQFNLMKETKQIYKNCFGEDLKMFNSRYFGYDENTLKAAENLGIKYILSTKKWCDVDSGEDKGKLLELNEFIRGLKLGHSGIEIRNLGEDIQIVVPALIGVAGK